MADKELLYRMLQLVWREHGLLVGDVRMILEEEFGAERLEKFLSEWLGKRNGAGESAAETAPARSETSADASPVGGKSSVEYLRDALRGAILISGRAIITKAWNGLMSTVRKDRGGEP